MHESQPTIVLVPGLGADERLFEAQRRVVPNLVVPPWLEPQPRETLPHYAQRMAEALGRIEPPFLLGGASFGGMLAQEMAPHLRPAALALIGSCCSGRDVRLWLRAVERVGHPLPTPVIDAARSLAPLVAPLVSSASRANLDLFLDMLRQTPTEFIRWAGRAIMRWRLQGEPVCPIGRLHGSRDQIIRPPRNGPVTIVRGAGHVLSMTHPEQTNEFILAMVRSYCGVARTA